MVFTPPAQDARRSPGRSRVRPACLLEPEVRVRPSVPAACAAVALLAAAATPALAAGEKAAVPAAGAATSAVTLLSVTAGGHDLAAGGVQLVTDTVSGTPLSRIVVTPLTADGTAHGTQTIEAGTTRTIDAVSSSTVVPALAGIAELSGPALEAGAKVVDGAPTATAAANSLGTLRVLGLPVAVDGLLKTSSAVSGDAAQSTKSFAVTGVALPSVADLLAALGLDLSKLPVEVVDELVQKLDLVTPAVTAANKALDDAQALVKTTTDAAVAQVTAATAAVEAATKDVTSKTAALDAVTGQVLGQQATRTAAEQAVAAANSTLAARTAVATAARSALAALPAKVSTLGPLGVVLGSVVNPALAPAQAAVTEADARVAEAQAAVTKATTDLAAASTAAQVTSVVVQAAKDALALAQNTLASANRVLDEAQKAVAALTADLAPQVRNLLAALTAVLDGTPLVSLDKVAVTTESVVTSAKAGGQRAGVEGGEVQGLKVLGSDVLDDVLGSSTLDLSTVTTDTLAKITAAVDGLTGTLSEVLSTVPGLPTLKVPAPVVSLLSKDAGTAVDGLFGTATTSVTGLKVTLPAITLPAAVALPNALSLPGLSALPTAALPAGLKALAAGDLLTSTPTTLGFGTLTEAARFRPGVAAVAAPTTVAPVTAAPTTAAPVAAAPVTTPVSLPRTGASGALAVLALVMVGGAVVLRRRELAQQ